MHPPEYSKRLKQILNSKINQIEYRMAQNSQEQIEETSHKPQKLSKKKHCKFTIISIHNKKKMNKLNKDKKCTLLSKLK